MACAGRLSTAEALKLALAYEEETELAVWTDLDQSIGKVAQVWQSTPSMEGIHALRRRLYAKAGARLGWGNAVCL